LLLVADVAEDPNIQRTSPAVVAVVAVFVLEQYRWRKARTQSR
jgi:hypothetical protein